MEREVGGGIGMGNTCKPMAVSFQCMTKFTTKKKKEYWTGLPFPSPGALPDLGIEPRSPQMLPKHLSDALPSESPGKLYFKKRR